MITLLIPTINRYSFIKKYLIYLNKYGFNGQVLIGDSSDESNYDATSNYIESNEFSFEVKQYSFPNMYPHKCIKKMLKDIKFPYSMFICDDDILVVSTLKKCIKFLESNPSYSGVGGVSVLARLDPENHNHIISSHAYRVCGINYQTASERVSGLFSDYTVVNYALARTEEFINRWPDDENEENYDKAIGTEVLPSVILAAQGNIKMIDELFVVRQTHIERIILPSFIDTILEPRWVSSVHFAVDKLSHVVSSVDQISYKKANIIVNNAWKEFLENQAINIRLRGEPTFLRRLSIRVKLLFGSKVHSKLRKFRQQLIILKNKKSLILTALLKPSAPYHIEFKQIYDVIEGRDK